MGTKAKLSTKVLSLFLSVLMAASCFGIVFPSLAPEAKAAGADIPALKDALDAALNGGYLGTDDYTVSVDENGNASVNDTTKNGYLFAVVRAVGNVAEAIGKEEGTDHNASLAAYICAQVDANEFQARFITAILPNAGKYAQYDGSDPQHTFNGSVADMEANLPETYTFTTTVSRDVKGAVLTDYESAYDVPATVDGEYKLTVTGTRTQVDSTNGVSETGAVYKNTAVSSEVTPANAPDLSAIKAYLDFVQGERDDHGNVTPSAFAVDYAAWLEDPNSLYTCDDEVLSARYDDFTALNNAALGVDPDYVEKFVGAALMNSHLQYANAALAASKAIAMKPYVDWIHGVETPDTAAFDGYRHRDNYQATDRAQLLYMRGKAETYKAAIDAAGAAVIAQLKAQYGYTDTFVPTADTVPMPGKTYYKLVLVQDGVDEYGDPVAKNTYDPIEATAENIAGLYECKDYTTYIADLTNQIQRYDVADIRTAAQYLLSKTVADEAYVFPAGSQFGSYQAASGTAVQGETYYNRDAFGFYTPNTEVVAGESVSGLYEWIGSDYKGMGGKTYYSEDYITAGQECPVKDLDLGATAAWFNAAVDYLTGCNVNNKRAVLTADEETAIAQMRSDLNAEIKYRAFDDNSAAFQSAYAYFVNLKLNNDLALVSTKVLTGYTEEQLDANDNPVTVNVPGLIATAEGQYTNLNNAFNAITGSDAATRARYQSFVRDARAYVNKMYATLLDRCYDAYHNLYVNAGNQTNGNGINPGNFTLVKGIVASLDDNRDTSYTEAVENDLQIWIKNNASTVVSKVGGDAQSRINHINAVQNAIPSYITACNAQMTGHWNSFGNRYYNDRVVYSGTAAVGNGRVTSTSGTETGTYTVRDGRADDMARADNDKDYVVTEARINSVITKLDNFARSTDFVKMIGVYDTYDSAHQVTDLASFIKSILEENLFTDDMVNTFVSMLFPMLADLIQNKMIGMLTGFLPGSTVINANGAFHLDLQTLMTSLVNEGKVEPEIPFNASTNSGSWRLQVEGWVRMSSLTGGVNVYMNGTYGGIKTFKEVFNGLGIKIWPSTLSSYLKGINPTKYKNFTDVLDSLNDNWMNLDRDRDGEITKDDFELAGITFGIKDYATFITVMGDILGAAGPLINTLFTNHNFDSGWQTNLVHVDINDASIYAHGEAEAVAAGYSFGPGLSRTIELGSASANGRARIQIDGMLGYNDLWLPIMEGLGITGYTSANNVGTNTTTTTPLSSTLGKAGNVGINPVANGLFLPLMHLINKVANKPIDTVLGMLPNLAYNIAYDNVTGLVDCLKTKLHVNAEVDDFGFTDVVIVDVISWHLKVLGVKILDWTPNLDVTWALRQFMGKLTDAINGFLEFNPDIDIGGMIDLKSTLPFDITNLNDAVGFLLDKIGGDSMAGLTLPAINTAHLGRLGTRNTLSSYRSSGHVDKGKEGYDRGPAYYVTADKADVLYELIDIVMSFAKQKGGLSGLLSGLGSSGIGAYIEDILAGIDKDKSLAALVELFEPQVYKMTPYSWYQPNSSVSSYTFNNAIYNGTLAQGGFVYLKYANQWTREKAQYMYDNVEKAVDDVMGMIDSDLLADYDGFSDMLLKNANKIFRNRYINGFLETLVGLAEKLDNESKSVANMLKEQLKVGSGAGTVDIFSWYYRFGFLFPELRILGTHEVADPTSSTGTRIENEVLYLDKNGNICVGYPETEQVKINGTLTNVTKMHFVRTYPLAPSTFKGFAENEQGDMVPAATGSNLPGRYNQANISYYYSPKYNTSHTQRFENYATCNNVSADGQYSASSITISGHSFANKNKVSGLFNDVTPVILSEADEEGNYVTWRVKGNANTSQWGLSSDDTQPLVDGHMGGPVKDPETGAVIEASVPTARSVFFAIVTSFFEPLAPAFSFVLNGQDLKLFNNALVIKGYDVYNGAIIPLLEALGVTNLLKSSEYNGQYATNPTGGFYYLANVIFQKLQDILKDDSATGGKTPLQKMIDMLPGLYYYLQSDGLGTLVKNILMPIWVLVDDVRPLVNVNLDMIIHGVAGKLLGVDNTVTQAEAADNPLYNILMSNLDMDRLLNKDPSDPDKLRESIRRVSLKKLKLTDMADLAGYFTGMNLQPLFYAFEGMCYGYTLNGTKYGTVKLQGSKHYDIATYNTNSSKDYSKTYTLSYLGPDTVTVTISALLDLLRYKPAGGGKSNAQALDDLIGLARDLLPGETLSNSVTATGVLDGLEKIFAARESAYTAPNWDYILEGKAVKGPDGDTILWDANTDWRTLLAYSNFDDLKLHNKHDDVTKRALGYKTDWTRETAVGMDQMFASLLDWVTTSFLAKDNAEITSFEGYVNDLVDNKLLGADTLKSLVGLIAKLYQTVPASVIGIIDELLETNLQDWARKGYFRPGVPTQKVLDKNGNPVLDDEGNEVYEKADAYYVNEEYKWWATDSQVVEDDNGDPVLDPETNEPIEIQVPIGEDYVDTRDEFFDAVTALITPVSSLFGFIFLEDGFKFFYSAGSQMQPAPEPNDDVDAINLEGLGIWGKGLIPLLEALGIRSMIDNFDQYAPSAYTTNVPGVYDSERFVTDFVSILRTFAEGIVADPVKWLLDNMPNLIYFINADGLSTAVKNIFDSVQDIIDMINTRLEASERISTSNLAGFNLSSLSLDGIFKMVEKFTAWEEETEEGVVEHPGLHVRDDLVQYIKDLYFGDLSHFMSANGKDAFRMDALATDPSGEQDIEDRANFITVLVALVLEIAEDKGTFFDPDNGFTDSAYDNPALLDHLFKTDGIVSRVINAVTNPEVFSKYDQINWFYFDETINIAENGAIENPDVTVDENTGVVEVPGYVFQYLNYTTKWTYDKAFATANGLEDMIVSVLQYVDPDKFGDLESIGDLINTETIYNGDMLQKLLDLLANLLYGKNAFIPSQILTTLGALLGADLTQWNRTYQFTADFGDAQKEGTENGMDYVTMPAKIPVLDEDGKQVKDEAGNPVYEYGDPIRTYLVNDRASFVAGATLMLAPAYRLLDWLLFNQDYIFFNGNTAATENDVLITLPGCKGYAKSLVLLLEALGCKGLKYPSFYEGVDENGKPTVDTEAYMSDILGSIANRLDEIIEDPVGEISGLIAELIYFINAGGLQTCVSNLAAGPLALVSSLDVIPGIEMPEGADEITPADVVNQLAGDAIDKALADLFKNGVTSIHFDMNRINLQYIFEVVEAITGFEITDLVGNKLDMFYMGEIYRYNSMSGEGDVAYKMTFSDEEDFADFITIILSLVVDVALNNVDAILDMFELPSSESMTAEELREIILGAVELIRNGWEVENPYPIDWLYFDDDASVYDSDDELKDPLPEISAETTVNVPDRFINYLTYASDWTDDLAHYIYNNRVDLINSVLKMVGAADTEVMGMKLGDIFNNGAAVNLLSQFYTGENLNTILNAVKGITEKLPEAVFKLLNIVLDVDLTPFNRMEAFPEGPMSREDFADGLVAMLTPLSGILDWMLFGNDLNYFDKDTDVTNDYDAHPEDIDILLEIPGANGYANGLVPLLNALGVNPPEATMNTTRTIAEPLIKSVLNRAEEILANPVDEILEMLPNLIYFINARGLFSSVLNLAQAPLTLLNEVNPKLPEDKQIVLPTLLAKLTENVEGLEFLNEILSDEEYFYEYLSKFDLKAIFNLIENATGLMIIDSENGFIDVEKIEKFYLGKIELRASNGAVIGTMSYTDEEDAADMLTIIVNLAVEMALHKWGDGEGESNAAVLEGLFKLEPGTITHIIEALYALRDKVPPVNYHWDYFNEIDDNYENSDGYNEAFYYRPKDQNLFVNYLTYDPGQSWTRETATAIYDNIPVLLEKILAATGNKSVSEMISGSFNLYTAENLNTILGYIQKAYEYIGDLTSLIGFMFNTDITGWDGMAEFTDDQIFDRDSFRTALIEMIKPLYPVLDWLLFDRDFTFFVPNENGNIVDGEPGDEQLIRLPGANGYAYALVPLLTLLDVDLPACDLRTTTCGTKDDPEDDNSRTFLDHVIDAVLTRMDEILADPVNEGLALLPQILYFINANGVVTMVENLLGAVVNAADVLVKNGTIPLPEGTEIPEDGYETPETLAEYVFDLAGIDINNLDLEGIINFLERQEFMKGLKINEVFTRQDLNGDGVKDNILEYFYIGAGAKRVETTVTNKDGTPYAIYKLVYSDPAGDFEGVPADVLTTLLSIVLEVLMYENSDHTANAAPIAAFVNSFVEGVNLTVENVEALRTLLREGIDDPEMGAINWAYVFGDMSDEALQAKIEAILSADTTALNDLPERTVNYLTYDAKNNQYMHNLWSEDAVKYVDEHLNDIVDRIINLATKGEYEDLDSFIKNNLDLFNDDNANMIVDLVVNLLGNLDELMGGDTATVDMMLDLVGQRFGIEQLSAIRTNRASGIHTAEAFVDFISETFAILNPILDWILFGKDYRFFTELETGKPHMIILKGGEGYKYGLAPILDALGVDTDLTLADGESKLHKMLMNIATRVEEILANPIDEALELLPELIYFINSDGLTVCANNLIAPIDGLLKAVGPEIGKPDLCLNSLIGDTVDLDNLTFGFVYDLLKEKTGITLNDEAGEPIGKYLETFYFGELRTETIYDDLKVVHMVYTDRDARYDMVTILVTLLLDVIVYGGNRDAIIDLLKNIDENKAEGIYNAAIALLTHNEVAVDMVPYNWILTQYDVNGDAPEAGQIVMPSTVGATLNQSIYGPLYTRPMGEYITKHFELFVDTWITLLGIDDGHGGAFTSLQELIDDKVGGTIYKTSVVQSVADALGNVIDNLRDMLGEALFNDAVEVIDDSLDIEIEKLEDYVVTSFAEGDREAFVQNLCDMLDPAAPILRWLLTGQSLSLFTDREGDDYIVLNGAKGYKDSIIPIMEALHVPTDSILTQEEFEAATAEDNTAMLTNIVNPILDRLDEILEDPLNEAFEVLPALAYFVNSKGLDSAFKNLLNAVYQLLETVDPVIADQEKLHKDGKVSLYPLMGRYDLEELDFEAIAELLLEFITSKIGDYGFELTGTLNNALGELTVGIVRSFASKRGETDYTMDSAGNGAEEGAGDRVDLATTFMRIVLNFISKPANVIALEKLLDGKVSGDGYKFLCATLENFQQFASTEDGMDKIMYTVYQIYYAAAVAGVATNNGLAEFNGNYSFLNQLFGTSQYSFFSQLEKSFGDLLNKWTGDVVDDDEVSPKGFIKLFQALINFFKKIINFIKGIFG